MIDKIIRTLRWCKDVEEGELIENSRTGYHRTYLNVSSPVSQVDLDIICALVSPILIRANHSFTIGNHMGEIVPLYPKRKA